MSDEIQAASDKEMKEWVNLAHSCLSEPWIVQIVKIFYKDAISIWKECKEELGAFFSVIIILVLDVIFAFSAAVIMFLGELVSDVEFGTVLSFYSSFAVGNIVLFMLVFGSLAYDANHSVGETRKKAKEILAKYGNQIGD